MKGGGTYRIKFPSMDWEEKESAIEIHCDAGEILTIAGNRAQIGIYGFVGKQNFKKTDVEEFRQGVAISGVWNKIPRVTTSEETGGIQASFYGFDMDRELRGLLSELFGNIGAGIPAYVRNDNCTLTYQVETMKAVSNEKGGTCF